MAAKSTFFVCVCAVLASNIIAGSSNTTGFLANGNTSGVPQNVSDVKSMLMDLAKKNITKQDVHNAVAKSGIASSIGGPCSDRCWPDFERCLTSSGSSASSCVSQNTNCISSCVMSR
eukprot:Skav227300  [mRNA]  locus=scaffold2645:214863:215213:- [translate_table: standard]